MTAVPDLDQFRLKALPGRARARGRAPVVTDAFWGYRIAGRRAPVWLVGLQGLCWIAGLAFGLVAVGIWVAPGASAGSDLLAFKLGASVPLAALAALLLVHASRGTTLAVEVDLRLGEVREVLSSRTGRSGVMARHGFDAVAGVTLERLPGHGDTAALALRLREGDARLVVARGPELMLAGLQDRLGRDLMVGQRKRLAEVMASVALAADEDVAGAEAA
jgi:hypothetical protein